MTSLAIIAACLPSEFRTIFGQDPFGFERGRTSYFSTDHPGLKIFSDEYWSYYHIQSFTQVIQSRGFGSIMYYFDRDEQYLKLEPLIRLYPGLILLEDIGPLRNWKGPLRQRFFSRLFQHQIEQCLPESELRLIHLLESSHGIFVLDRRQQAFLERGLTSKPVIHLTHPRQPITGTGQTNLDRRAGIDQGRLNIGILSRANDQGFHDEVRSSLESSQLSSIWADGIATHIISLPDASNDFAVFVDTFKWFISDKNLLIVAQFGASFREYALVKEAILNGLPTIIHATSLWGYLDSNYLLKLYPRSSRVQQLRAIWQTLIDSPAILDYLSQQLRELNRSFTAHDVSLKNDAGKPAENSLETCSFLQRTKDDRNRLADRWLTLLIRDRPDLLDEKSRAILDQQVRREFL